MSKKHVLTVISLGLLGSAALAQPVPVGTAFTYQGRLVEGGQPASGLYALHFTLWDEATRGLRLGEPQIDDRVVVSNGLFTVTLDFGARPPYFTGDARWLEIAVDHYHSTNYVTLAPRQPLTPTPYAMFAPAAGSVPASGLTGTVPDARLSANVALLNSSPTFTGTVQAAQVQGGGAGLTGVIPADNSVTSIKIVDNAVAAVDLASEVASLHKVSGGHLTVDADGNVGLGMSTPGVPLNFAHEIGDKISLYGTGTNHYGLGIQAGLLQIHGSTASADIAFGYGSSTNFTEQMRIQGTGNVGVNKPNPSTTLDVNGTVTATAFVGPGAGLTGITPADNSVTSAKILNGAILNADLADNSVNAAKIADGSVTSLKIADNTVAAVDLASEVGSLSKVSGGHLTVTSAGNLGLGTATPDWPLDVQAGQAVGRFLSTSLSSVSFLELGNIALTASELGAINFNNRYDTTPGQIAYSTTRGLTLRVNGAERARITPAGNFGIGTNDPQATLHVRGDLLVESATVAKLGALRVELGNSTAGANYATAMGRSTADGSYSTAMGASTANGNYSTALGYSTASGSYATALGTSTAQGTGATALGYSSAATTNYSLAAGRRAKANHEGSFVWADSQNADFASTDRDQVRIRATNGVHLVAPKLLLEDSWSPDLEFKSTNGASGVISFKSSYLDTSPSQLNFFVDSYALMSLYRYQSGTHGMTVFGPISATTFNPSSDRNMKENFAPVEAQAVLDKVIALPISRWNFKGDAATPHVGPMAQDFHAAFQTGSDDKHIATVDADGVALAAIQGLNQKLEAKNAALEQEMAELRSQMKALAEKVNGGGQ